MIPNRSFLFSMIIVLIIAAGCTAPPTVQPTYTPVIQIVERTVVVTPTNEPEKKPIKIGIAAAFSGAIAYVGEGEMMGATLALEEMGGKIAGYPIILIPADNAGDPALAVTAVRRLVDVDKVDLILGSGTSNATLAVLPLLPELGIVQLNVDSSSTKIYDASGDGRNEWSFRAMNDSNILSIGFAPFIAEKTKSISFIAYNDDYGRSTVASIEPLLTGLGVNFMGGEYFERGASDVRPLLLKIKEANPESLLITATEGDAITVLRQFKELGMTQKLFGLNSSIVTPLFNEMSKDEPGLNEGVLEGKNYSSGMDPAFDEAFVKRWGTAPSSHRSYYYHAMKYIVGPAIELAASYGGDITRESIKRALKELRVETPLGNIWFDDHNQAYNKMAVSTVKDGVIVLIAVIPTNPHEQ
jgi:branched-chain amino acid transport system substrate-binding protein